MLVIRQEILHLIALRKFSVSTAFSMVAGGPGSGGCDGAVANPVPKN